MVALGAAGGEHIVAAFLQGVGQQELQLAHLVAAQGYAGHIVPLDVYVFAGAGADIGQPVKGGGQLGQGNTRNGRNISHGGASFFHGSGFFLYYNGKMLPMQKRRSARSAQ